MEDIKLRLFGWRRRYRSDFENHESIGIYGINSHDSQYLFELIEAGFYVEKNTINSCDEIKAINIELLSYKPGVLNWFKSSYKSILFDSAKFSFAFLAYISSKSIIRGKMLKWIAPRVEGQYFSTDYSSILKMSRSKRGISLNHQNLNLTIKAQNLGLFTALAISVQSIANLTVSFFRCGMPFAYNHERFMRLQCMGSNVGQVAASVSLNRIHKLSGQYRPVLGVWLNLKHSISLAINASKLNTPVQSFFLPHESTYFDSIYAQVFHASGRNIVEKFTYNRQFKTWSGTDDMDNFFYVDKAFTFTPGMLESVDKYMEACLQGDLPSYYSLGRNESRNFLDATEKSIKLNFEEPSAVVFMHSFNDGQYIYGYDGFRDIYDWTHQCISHLIESEFIKRIYVKPHPHVDYQESKVELGALQKLIAEFASEQKVVFCHPSLPVQSLAKFEMIYGITHHGSIFEEFQYLGKPVIASSFGPWREHYNFTNLYETSGQLRSKILNVSESEFPCVSFSQREELYTYIYNYRIAGVSWESKLITKRVSDTFHWAPDFRTLDFIDRENFFLRMRTDDDRFIDILSFLWAEQNR